MVFDEHHFDHEEWWTPELGVQWFEGERCQDLGWYVTLWHDLYRAIKATPQKKKVVIALHGSRFHACNNQLSLPFRWRQSHDSSALSPGPEALTKILALKQSGGPRREPQMDPQKRSTSCYLFHHLPVGSNGLTCWPRLQSNVNPWLINPGWLIVVVPPTNSTWLLKWYFSQINSRLGLLIRGWQYSKQCMVWESQDHTFIELGGSGELATTGIDPVPYGDIVARNG